MLPKYLYTSKGYFSDRNSDENNKGESTKVMSIGPVVWITCGDKVSSSRTNDGGRMEAKPRNSLGLRGSSGKATNNEDILTSSNTMVCMYHLYLLLLIK